MRRVLTALAIGAFAIAAPLAAAPAQADPGNGATVLNDTQCFPIDGGYTACLTVRGVSNETTTPSGNTSSQVEGTTTSTIKDPDGRVVSQATRELHYHLLAKDGVIHEDGEHVTATFPLGGKTCTFRSDFHYANGDVRYGKFQVDCS